MTPATASAQPCNQRILNKGRFTHLELSVETGSLIRPLWDLVGLGLLPRCGCHLKASLVSFGDLDCPVETKYLVAKAKKVYEKRRINL